MESISVSQFKQLVASGQCPKIKAKRKSPEEDLHIACLQWVMLEQRSYPLLRWLVHVPNGGKRPKGEAGKLKAMGTKPGYPDLTLPRPSLRWKGLAIELKSPIGRTSTEQEEWLGAFHSDGWLVGVCRTLDEFIALVRHFLQGSRLIDTRQLWVPKSTCAKPMVVAHGQAATSAMRHQGSTGEGGRRNG